MIEFLTIIDLKTDSFYNHSLYQNTLFFSDANNHGKTVIIRSIMRALGTDEKFDKKKDNIDLTKMIIIISINDIQFIVHKNYFFIYENELLKKVERKNYNDKLLSMFKINRIIPSIQTKKGIYLNLYLNILFTFFYINPDLNGYYWNQLGCNMYLKKDVYDYFFKLQLEKEYLIKLEENEKILNKNRLFQTNKKKDYESISNSLNFIFDKISKNEDSKVYLTKDIDTEIGKFKTNIKDKYKEKWKLERKIYENENIIKYLESIKLNINEKYQDEFFNKEIDYFYYDNEFAKEFKLKIKLLDFVNCNEIIKSLFNTSAINQKINEIKEKNKKNINIKNQYDDEILKMKDDFNTFLSISKINLFDKEFIEKMLEKNINDFIEFKKNLFYDKKIIDENNKLINKIISNNKKDFAKDLNSFKSKYNWEGGTNSSSFSDIIYMYSKLNENESFKNLPLIIDAFGKMELDDQKKEFIIKNNNQKIFAITSKNSNNDIIFFEKNNFNIIDLSDPKNKKNVINNNISNLEKENKKSYIIYQSLTLKGYLN